jgi:hypothetical protein
MDVSFWQADADDDAAGDDAEGTDHGEEPRLAFGAHVLE